MTVSPRTQRAAAEKRQGTKSREVGHRLGSGRWGFNAYRGTEDSAVGVSAGVKRRNGRGGNPAERFHNFRVLA